MTATAETNLLFNWGPPRKRARALVLFISASLLLHALCFYVFQITYPPSVSLVPPPARVNLISDKTEDGRALLRWIDAEDPALVSTTVRARPRELPKIEHVPSYMTARAPLKQLPPLVVDLTPPNPLPPGPVPVTQRAAPTRTTPVPTTVEFSEEIAARGAPKFPETEFSAATNEQPQSIRFHIAVNGRGEVQYVFPLNSSGDAALDAQARQHIGRARFANAPNDELTWGAATVEWGADVSAPSARSTSTPAP
ncbi:MAG: hypothetical protein QOG48_2164 [Verrucomicrobiota bacterium]|jgi:hypothetical protein